METITFKLLYRPCRPAYWTERNPWHAHFH